MVGAESTQSPPKKRAYARPGWDGRFLEALTEFGLVSWACRAVGIDRKTAYNRRSKDAAFAEAWDEAIWSATGELEVAAIRQAKEGSDTMLMFVLKALKPEMYRERRSPARADSRPPAEVPRVDPEIVAAMVRAGLDAHDAKARARAEDRIDSAMEEAALAARRVAIDDLGAGVNP